MKPTEPVSCQFYENSLLHNEAGDQRCINIFFHLSGQQTLKAGGSSFESDKSFVFIIPPSASFSFKGKGLACLLSCSELYLKELLSTGFGRKLEFLFRPPVALSAFRPEMYSADRMRCLLENIGREISLKRSDYLDMVHINLYEILILLKRAGALDTGELKDWASRYRIWDMEDIVLYINDNFDESLTLDDLASRCALNSSYFSRRFKERTGIPLFEYINHLRIDRSCGLLRNSSLTILEIAMSVGYNNVSFFNRYFKRLKGISPGEYRRRMK